MIHVAAVVAAFLCLAFVALFILGALLAWFERSNARSAASRDEEQARKWAQSLSESETARWLPIAINEGLVTAWRTAIAARN
ncbi:MAG: hypothetical protein ACRET2_02610 [Steroidobacteraceae bacterium]